MRTEQEMMELITETARKDSRIRAAYIEGSRANPRAPRDLFQDYDIEYIVTETKSFREDPGWIDLFGERFYMQYPEEWFDQKADVERSYGWLIQLADGNRLDLHVCTKEHALEHLDLYKVLIDKDGIFQEQEQTSDERYWVKMPSPEEFSCVCNEFWWCLNNVAKGLWRKELPYVLDMLDFQVRPMLKRLLEWKIGCEQGFCVSPGKAGKYMKNYLSGEIYHQFLATYGLAERECLWETVLRMCDLFWKTEEELGKCFGYECNKKEASNSRRFLECVRELPDSAEEISFSEHSLSEP